MLFRSAGVVTIDGDDKDRVLYVYNGSNLISVSVSGLTITGGYDSANAGGITSWDEEIELDSVVITGNTGDYAGGIYFRGGGASLTIRNSTISGNEGLSFGGGAYITSAGTDGYTGLVIENSTISGNTSGAYGGAFYFAHSDGDSIIRNSTISGNSALYDGGGVYVSHTVTGSVSIENSTITGNSADHGGGVFIVDSSATPVSIVNSVIAGNTATAVTDSDSGAGNDIASSNAEPISIDHSLIGDTVGYTADAGTGNLSGDPKLGALADNGGPTKTHLPQAGSPVIDAGDPSFETPPSTDQRGLARVSNGRIDMGAVEVQPAVLPPTGGSNGLMASLGAGLLALGGALHLTGRRNRTA